MNTIEASNYPAGMSDLDLRYVEGDLPTFYEVQSDAEREESSLFASCPEQEGDGWEL